MGWLMLYKRLGGGKRLSVAGWPDYRWTDMTFSQRAWPSIQRWLRRCWAIFWRALVKYDETDGEQRAASFAYYAFFALFPLIVLMITVGTMLAGGDQAVNFVTDMVTKQVKDHMPVDPELADSVIRTIQGVVKSRTKASLIAFAILIWSAIRFFQALVHGVNKAWGTKEYTWWRLPLKNFVMVGILASALLLGSLAPVIVNNVEYYYSRYSWEVGLDFRPVYQIFGVVRALLPPFVLFYGFAMFYKLAPRRRTTLREIWFAALVVTLGMDVLQRLFLLYTRNITNFNAIYGTFGSIVALLMWIYLTGTLIIFGGCLSAAQYEIDMSLTDQSERERES
jgi:YihY family inner membrane protein